MRIAKSTYRKSLLSLAIFLWLGAFCVVLLYGCYPNIKWAEDKKIEYSVTYVDKEIWESCGFIPELRALYYTPFNGDHWIIIREDLKKDLKYLDHELHHARDPEWRH